MFHSALFVAAGFVAGAFCPAIGRKIKAFFIKHSAEAKAEVKTILPVKG